MKHQAGFTLIELVVVIVILGILAIAAAPKFLNMQGDARESALKGLEAAIKSTAEMVHAKAVIAGNETASASTVTIANGKTVKTTYGYPNGSDLMNMLDISASSAAVPGDTDFIYDLADNAPNTMIFWPTSGFTSKLAQSTCNVTYSDPRSAGDAPLITFFSGC